MTVLHKNAYWTFSITILIHEWPNYHIVWRQLVKTNGSKENTVNAESAFVIRIMQTNQQHWESVHVWTTEGACMLLAFSLHACLFLRHDCEVFADVAVRTVRGQFTRQVKAKYNATDMKSESHRARMWVV